MEDNNNINYEELNRAITHWNENRVPILKISYPDRDLQFQGAIRFYFQDAGQKVATKCVNVTSADTTKDVINVLIEKFRPDMRMLSVPEYGLYEIHENGEERKLAQHERPIFVQLEWNKDDREGRFLLRRMDEKTRDLSGQDKAEPSLRRKLSKKEKKRQQQVQQQQQKKESKEDTKKNGIAERLYNELPETSFTRSISNPEAVMKRRRAQKLEKRLQEAGGTLRIFGDTLNKDVSYKTLLVSAKDTASFVVKQVLEKYNKETEDPTNYCLVQLIVPQAATMRNGDATAGIKESILDDDDCPLLIQQNHYESSGVLTFHIRLKPADYMRRKKKQEAMQPLLMQPIMVPASPPYHQQYIPTATSANDQILPALIQVREQMEDIFLGEVITLIKPTDISFRLAPTYVLYMVSRYRASTLFHPELQAPSRAELFMPFTKKIAVMIRSVIEAHIRDPTYLAFWLANSSDLSHFYKQDKHLSHFTIDAQEILYDSIKRSFKYLLSCKQMELDAVLHQFFDEHEDGRPNVNDSAVDPILEVLNNTMATMRKNRVNTALTIQIFAHLFHHISKWLFDRLIGVYDNQPDLLGNQANFNVYCNRIWGEKLNRRLAVIGHWAERHGLEPAAEFHFARVTQVTLFLMKRYIPPRISPNDLKQACDSCDRLNPVQLRALLDRYQPEQPIVGAIKENLLYTMDYSFMACDYPLEEDFELKIPFHIPEDGYSSDLIRYIPNGLLDFISYLSKIRVQDQELCTLTVQPTSSGHWTVYFKNHQLDTPESIIIQLRKQNNSMGLSIIGATGVGQDKIGIYIKNVIKNGAAAMDGRLQAGDQLLEVDGHSLLDISQDQAAELMLRTGPIVTLKIAKQAAIYHHVTEIINNVPTNMPAQSINPQQFQSQHSHHHQNSYQQNNHQQDNIHHNNIHQNNRHAPPPQHILQQRQAYVTYSPPLSQNYVPPPPPQQPAYVPPPPPLITTLPSAQSSPPSPPKILEHAQSTGTLQSPMKSPKKVSWVDTQPHQSLHTLIPLTQESEPNEPTTESLTLEDIDEVLSSETQSNWIEDSAGVIGTQEVYNDPRQRIVKERERPSDDVNVEKLSFQEKLKMFNISSEK